MDELFFFWRFSQNLEDMFSGRFHEGLKWLSKREHEWRFRSIKTIKAPCMLTFCKFYYQWLIHENFHLSFEVKLVKWRIMTEREAFLFLFFLTIPTFVETTYVHPVPHSSVHQDSSHMTHGNVFLYSIHKGKVSYLYIMCQCYIIFIFYISYIILYYIYIISFRMSLERDFIGTKIRMIM